jgi:hypothetical protein
MRVELPDAAGARSRSVGELLRDLSNNFYQIFDKSGDNARGEVILLLYNYLIYR